MQTVIHVLILLLTTALSAPLGRLARVPLPLLQIALGMGLVLCGLHVGFDPDTFLLLFIPPLLFSDAVVMPKRDFLELRGIILAMAFGLVLFSTLACGVAVHAMIPEVSLAACFTLSAILSPTDAVAVAGMIPPGRAPRRFLHILEGEALLNDASGLVCFKFAAAAAMTGGFSAGRATEAFVVIAAGGAAMGAAVAWAFVRLDRLVLLRGAAEPATQIVLLALLPFASYLAADALGVSGILAAVASGMTVSQMRLFGASGSQTRLRATAVWEMIGFVFNGLIFLLLGMQLPNLVLSGISISEAAHRSAWLLPVFVIAITLSLIAVRFVWIWLVLGVRSLAARLSGRRYTMTTNLPLTVAMSVAGVRGAVTLAGILSLPLAGATSQGFPDRSLLVVLAAGTILCSLLLATACLPALLRHGGVQSIDAVGGETLQARRALLEAAVAEIGRSGAEREDGAEQAALRAEAVAILLAEVNRRLARLADDGSERERALRAHRLEAAIRLKILRTQRMELVELAREKRVSDDVEAVITRELDFEEELLLARSRSLKRPDPAAPFAA